MVVGVKGADHIEPALGMAMAEARSLSCPLRVVYGLVLPVPGRVLGYVPSPNEVAREARREVDQVVDRAAREDPDLEIEGMVVLGRAHDALVDESRQAHLLVLGSRMRGTGKSLLLGSVSSSVAAHAWSPVLVARGATDRISRVVVGTDHSPHGKAAVRFAFDEASRRGVPLRVVSTWEIPLLGGRLYWMVWQSMSDLQEDAESQLDREIAAERERYPELRVDTVVEQSEPASMLLHQVRDDSLVVVGSRGHSGVSGVLLGSVSQAMLHHAPCSVAVVHSQGDQAEEQVGG